MKLKDFVDAMRCDLDGSSFVFTTHSRDYPLYQMMVDWWGHREVERHWLLPGANGTRLYIKVAE